MKATALPLFLESCLSLIGFVFLVTLISTVFYPEEKSGKAAPSQVIQSTIVVPNLR